MANPLYAAATGSELAGTAPAAADDASGDDRQSGGRNDSTATAPLVFPLPALHRALGLPPPPPRAEVRPDCALDNVVPSADSASHDAEHDRGGADASEADTAASSAHALAIDSQQQGAEDDSTTAAAVASHGAASVVPQERPSRVETEPPDIALSTADPCAHPTEVLGQLPAATVPDAVTLATNRDDSVRPPVPSMPSPDATTQPGLEQEPVTALDPAADAGKSRREAHLQPGDHEQRAPVTEAIAQLQATAGQLDLSAGDVSTSDAMSKVPSPHPQVSLLPTYAEPILASINRLSVSAESPAAAFTAGFHVDARRPISVSAPAESDPSIEMQLAEPADLATYPGLEVGSDVGSIDESSPDPDPDPGPEADGGLPAGAEGLPPDHPLLARAQAALRSQLRATRMRLEQELSEKRKALKARFVPVTSVPNPTVQCVSSHCNSLRRGAVANKRSRLIRC